MGNSDKTEVVKESTNALPIGSQNVVTNVVDSKKTNPDIVDNSVKNNPSLNKVKGLLEKADSSETQPGIEDSRSLNKAKGPLEKADSSETQSGIEGNKSLNAGQEVLEAAKYKEDKVNIIKNIMTWKLNMTDYGQGQPSDVDTNFTYYNGVFLSEDSNLVKGYLANYNLQKVKEGAPDQIINIDNFMVRYIAEKPKKMKTVITETTNDPGIQPDRINQKVGEFVELDPDKQKTIIADFGKIVDAGGKINSLKIDGYADATMVGSEKATRDEFTYLRNTLIDKGLDAKKLPPTEADFFKGIESMDAQQRQNLLNKGWAECRAMMHISFLPKEYIKYINDNTTKLEMIPHAEKVGAGKVGNQYTGESITMGASSSEKTKIKLTEIKERVLSRIDVKWINYAYTDGTNYYPVGGVSLGNTSGTLTIDNVKQYDNKDNKFLMPTNSHPLPPDVIATDVKDNNEKSYKKTFFGENSTLWILINDPAKKDKKDENVEKVTSLNQMDTRIADQLKSTGKMTLVNDSGNDIDGFVKLLKEFQEKSPGDKTKSAYIDNTVAMLNVYKDVDAQLKDAQEVKRITIS